MNKEVPLSILLETAKRKYNAAVNEMLAETKLPAYLVEGIVYETLAEIRARKSQEILHDYTAMQNKAKESTEG